MKFWKLKMNDRNYLLVSVRREHMRDVTLCSEQMQQEHQSFAGSIVREDIRFQIVEDANPANLCSLEAVCCLGCWYRKAYHDDLLHKIAVGVSRGGKSLLRWSNNKIYLSAPVYMDYEGIVRKM